MRVCTTIFSPSYKIFQGIGKLLNFCIVSGLLLGLFSMLLDSKMIADISSITNENFYEFVSPTPFYKFIKSLEIFFILIAGILAYWTEGRFFANRDIKLIMSLLLLWMTGHAFVTFSNGFSNAELIGPKGPLVWWSVLLVFAGYSRERWQKIIYPSIKIIALIGAFEMVYRISNLSEVFYRVEVQQTLRISIQILLWTAPLVFLVPNKNKIGKLFSIALLSLLAIAALITATRSWLIVCAIYMMVWIFCILHKVKRADEKITFFLIIFLIILPMVIFIFYILFKNQIHSGGYLLSSRIALDSRTWQIQQFFMNVPFTDLIIGAGPRGTWRMGNRDYGYVDGVFFLLLFIGGIPLLFSYIYLVIYPAIRCFFKRGLSLYGSPDFPCIFMCTIWGLVMTGLGTYTAPELKMNHYIILLCTGRCWCILKNISSKNNYSRISFVRRKSCF